MSTAAKARDEAVSYRLTTEVHDGAAAALDVEVNQALGLIIEAYHTVGLAAVASILDESAVAWRREGDLDELGERYIQFTYSENNDQPDAVEGAALRYAQLHETAFASAAAERAGGWRRCAALRPMSPTLGDPMLGR